MADPSDPPDDAAAAPDGTPRDADFRQMVESVSDYAIFLLDPEGCIISWNTGAQRMKGYTAADVLGRHIRIFYPEEQIASRWPDHELKVARETGRFEDEGWRLRKDGSRFWANIIITRLTDPDGRLRGFSKITRDLSERRRQEEMLRQSEERFRLLVEQVSDYAIFMLDPGGRILNWNTGAQRTKGYTASEVVGRHFSIFYPEEVAASGWPDEELRMALRDGRYEEDGWRLRKDGGRFWANVVITPLRDRQGKHIGFAKVTRDLTERRRMTLLEDEGRRMSTFLAMLGHELRNPLAPIAYALSIMDRDEAMTESTRRMHGVIGRQLRQVTRLVDDLLEVGRITNGKIFLDRRPVRLREALVEAVEAAEPAMRAKGHTLALALHDADPWVDGDAARIQQIVGNLLVNAAKFTPPGGHVRLSLAESAGHAEIHVSDDGPGIPPAMLGAVFQLFVQGEQDIARPHGGLGLGLSLVQQFTALHGGDVSAFSTGRPGEGCEFLVRLPVLEPPAHGAAPATARRTGAGCAHVLVVDDNRDAADMLRLLLTGHGHTVQVAYDGLAAIDAIKSSQPDVALLDIGLPGLSGIEVARRVQAEIRNPPPMVAISGYGLPGDRAAATAAGFQAHLTKPVSELQLFAVLDELLAPPG